MSESTRPGAAPPPQTAGAPAAPNGRRRRRALTALATVFLIGALAWGAQWFLAGRWVVETDNAYVSGNVVQVMPQVAGTVRAIMADDTDTVQPGQTLVSLDATDARVALDQAEAQLAQAVREARQLYANASTVGAQVTVRQAELARAQADETRLAADIARTRAEVARAQDDLARSQTLVNSGAASREELEHASAALATARAAQQGAQAAQQAARAAAQAARASIGAAREQVAASRSLVEGTDVQHHPSVLRAAARLREAWVALRRTEIAAPVGGQVARRAVQVGQRVQPGVPLLAIIPPEQMWVDANFKEVQLRDLRVGQPVRLEADAYGDRVEYDGRIVGLGAGTGAAFSLLPAQNATGNWIKVVQRVPVRIQIDPQQLARYPLRVGLSMQARVDVKDRAGAPLTDAPRAPAPNVADVRSLDADTAEADARIAAIIAANLGAAGEAGPRAAAAPARL